MADTTADSATPGGGTPSAVVVLAGGVGGSKLADGLQAHLGDRLTVVVNTADDLELHGLVVCPDHDTVMYTLAGLEDPSQGWGLAGETFSAHEMLDRYGAPTWFRLGDRDLATHIVRTTLLRAGERPTTVARRLQAALAVRASILPMTDDSVRTEVRTDDGWLEFQEYFVHRRQEPTVHEVRFAGIDVARASAEVSAALDAARAIVLAPSNPIVSIGPILAVPGMRQRLLEARARGVPIVAVSGIIGGRALKGPADRMLASLGYESSALGVARLYEGLVATFVIDSVDANLGPAIEALGMRVIATDTIMTDRRGRASLAADVLAALG